MASSTENQYRYNEPPPPYSPTGASNPNYEKPPLVGGLQKEQPSGYQGYGSTYPQAAHHPAANVATSTVIDRTGGCPICHAMLMERTNVCALVLLIILCFAFFPVGLYYLFCLKNTKYYTCQNGHVVNYNPKPIYILFGVLIALEILLIIIIVAIDLAVIGTVASKHQRCCNGPRGYCCSGQGGCLCYGR